jgi:hypothetical protein
VEGFRLFRQKTAGEWDPVVEDVVRAPQDFQA